MEPLVSVIVPIYKVEEYINKCVDSIIAQTYKNLEIILVDDGSPDKCGEICDEYAAKDKRIRVIHQKNTGLSDARNNAVKIARGEYLTFVDSDDWLEHFFVEKLVSLCQLKNAQIGIMKMVRVSKTGAMNHVASCEELEILSPQEAIEYSLIQKEYSCCAPGKIYKTEIVKDIPFPAGRISEDLATCHLFMDKAQRIVYTHEIGYFYLQREKSIMHVFNKKRMDTVVWAKSIIDFCDDNYPVIKTSAECRLFNVAFLLLLDTPDQERETQRELWNEIKKTRQAVFNSDKVRYKEKCAALLTLLGLRLSVFLGRKMTDGVR